MSLVGLRTSAGLILREEPQYFDRYIVFDSVRSIQEHVDLPTLRILEAVEKNPTCKDCVQHAISRNKAAIPLSGLLNRGWLKEISLSRCPHDLQVIPAPVADFTLPLHPEALVATLSTPTAATLLITRRCNLRCVHCNVSASSLTTDERIGVHIWTRVMDELEEMKVCKVVLSGGEPFTHQNFEELFRHFAKKRYAKGILTNGTMIAPRHIAIMKEANIVPVLSLDGSTAATHDGFRRTEGAYATLMRTLQQLAESEVPFALTTVVHSGNRDELKGIVDIAYNHYAGRLTLTPLKALGRGRRASTQRLDRDSYKLLLKEVADLKARYRGLRIAIEDESSLQFDHYGAGLSDTEFIETPYGFTSCAGGTDTLVVDWEGGVYPCMLAMQLRLSPIGHVQYKSLKNVWRNGDWGVFRQPIRYGCRAAILARSRHRAMGSITLAVESRQRNEQSPRENVAADG